MLLAFWWFEVVLVVVEVVVEVVVLVVVVEVWGGGVGHQNWQMRELLQADQGPRASLYPLYACFYNILPFVKCFPHRLQGRAGWAGGGGRWKRRLTATLLGTSISLLQLPRWIFFWKFQSKFILVFFHNCMEFSPLASERVVIWQSGILSRFLGQLPAC